MPNTLVHFGVQGLATRAVLRDADLRCIFIGCLIPDVPWIVLRSLRAAGLAVDPYDALIYGTIQASLLLCLLLAAAVAACARRPRPVFAMLAGNSLLHLLLDACEKKWGNGVHLAAPFSWKLTSFSLVWPESAIVSILTLVGLGLTLSAFRRLRQPVRSIARPGPARLLIALALAGVYFVLPLAWLDGPYEADNRYARTMRERRLGVPFELDRVLFDKLPEGDRVRDLVDLEVDAVGNTPPTSGLISVRGVFRDSRTIEIREFRSHPRWSRDTATYVALLLFAALWLAALRARYSSARAAR